MAFVSVRCWTADELVEWLRGLGEEVKPYIDMFKNKNVVGDRMLSMANNILDMVQINKIGHRELILEAIELLQRMDNCLVKENLQSLSLNLQCSSQGLHNLIRAGQFHVQPAGRGLNPKLPNDILSAIIELTTASKQLVSWLDRPPFVGEEEYMEIRDDIVHLALDIAQSAQQDIWLDTVEEEVLRLSKELSVTCENIVKLTTDPFVIQPAHLELVTIKLPKPHQGLGIYINSSYDGTHVITGTIDQSPAERCGKVSNGDEVIQVNYRTVVGWTLSNLVESLKEDPNGVILTLKRRPKNLNLQGQVKRRMISPKRPPKHFTDPKQGPRASKKEAERCRSPLIELFMPPLANETYRAFEPVSDRDHLTVDPLPPVYTDPLPPVYTDRPRSVTFSEGQSAEKLTLRTDQYYISGRPRSLPVDDMLRSLEGDKSSERLNMKKSSPAKLDYESHTDTDQDDKGFTSPEFKSTIVPSPSENNNTQRSTYSPTKPDVKSSSEYSSISSSPGLHLERQSTIDSDRSSEGVIRSNSTILVPEIRMSHSDSCSSGGITDSSFKSDECDKSCAYVKPISSVGKSSPRRVHAPDASAVKTRDKGGKARRSKIVPPRRISVLDLGDGEYKGWLWKKSAKKNFNKWKKYLCILKKDSFYFYKGENERKAEGVITLPGLDITEAPGHKKDWAFKVCDPKRNMYFYFAADNEHEMTKWLQILGTKAMMTFQLPEGGSTHANRRPSAGSNQSSDCISVASYSESEDDLDERSPESTPPNDLATSQTQVVRDDESLETDGGPVDLERGGVRDSFNLICSNIKQARLTFIGNPIRDYTRDPHITLPSSSSPTQTKKDRLYKKFVACERTKKAKEAEVVAIDALLSTNLSSKSINTWSKIHPDIVCVCEDSSPIQDTLL